MLTNLEGEMYFMGESDGTHTGFIMPRTWRVKNAKPLTYIPQLYTVNVPDTWLMAALHSFVERRLR